MVGFADAILKVGDVESDTATAKRRSVFINVLYLWDYDKVCMLAYVLF